MTVKFHIEKILPSAPTGADKFVLQSRALFNKKLVHEIAKNPTVVIPTLREVTVEECKSYIKSRQVSIWGPHIISGEDDLEKAARWFQREITNFYAHLLGDESRDIVPSRSDGE
jgi:hypothetical protein